MSNDADSYDCKAELLAGHFPWPRTTTLGIPPQYSFLRKAAPVFGATLASGQSVWLVTRYADVCAVLADARVSSEHSHPGFPTIFPITRHRDVDGAPPKLSYSGMDPPEHTYHRKRVAEEFSFGRIAGLRSRVEEIVDMHIDGIETGPRPCDLVLALADPVPAAVICELLGVPVKDRQLVQELSRLVLSHRGCNEEVKGASDRLHKLVSDLIDSKRDNPADDLISRLVAEYKSHGELNHEHMVQFVGALLTAGHETTSSMIALSVVALLVHTDAWTQLVAERHLVGNAVDELLRYLSVADMVTARVARADLVIGQTTISAGEGIIALTASANHDPAVFDAPECLDIHRDAKAHLAFGYGIHKCLGQHLARLEVEVVLERLLARLPSLHLAVPVPPPRWPGRTVFHGVEEVFVSW